MESQILRCSRCQIPLGDEDRRASISAEIMGDEYTDAYYYCAACQSYTVRTLHDRFLGPESTRDSKPIEKDAGDEQVRAIRACPKPYDGRCRCPGHRAHFKDSLD